MAGGQSIASWEWWLKSDAGLLARLAIGTAIFAALAFGDLASHGRQARRWREYLFLLLTATAGIAYGAVNDSFTSALSWEYFYYGKGLADEMGPRTPPDSGALRWEAVKIGAKAAGSAGLLAGAVLLLANNPSRKRPDRPPITYRRLLKLLPGILLATIACAAALGAIGYLGGLAWTSEEVRLTAKEGLFRPPRFQAAYGTHLGGYVGAASGLIWAVWHIRRIRRDHSGQLLPDHRPRAPGPGQFRP